MNREVVESLAKLNYAYIQYSAETDTYAALMPLAYTVAIAYDISPEGFYEERYCYENPTLAIEELLAWSERGLNEKRPKGWIACRMVGGVKLKKSFETHYGVDYALKAKNVYQELLSKCNGRFVPYEESYPLISEDNNDAKHQIAYLRVTNQID